MSTEVTNNPLVTKIRYTLYHLCCLYSRLLLINIWELETTDLLWFIYNSMFSRLVSEEFLWGSDAAVFSFVGRPFGNISFNASLTETSLVKTCCLLVIYRYLMIIIDNFPSIVNNLRWLQDKVIIWCRLTGSLNISLKDRSLDVNWIFRCFLFGFIQSGR